MDAPSWGDAVGYTGTDPTSLHQTLLPRNLPRFCPSGSLFRQPFLVLIRRRAPLRQGCVISTVSYYKLHNFISVRLYFCFKNSAKWRLHNSCFRKVVCVSTHTPKRRSDTKQKYHNSLKLWYSRFSLEIPDAIFRVLKAVRTRLELVSVTPCITTIFIGLIHLCSQIVATIEYFEST